MRIEPASTDDVDDLVDAWVALAETQRRHGSHLAAEPNREAIRPVLAYHAVDGSALVARTEGSADDGGSVVGFVNFGIEDAGLEGDAVRGLVHNVFVSPEFREAGVGSALLDAAEAELAERDADVIAIEALADNAAARRLYRRRGYKLHRVQYERMVESDTITKDGD